MKKIRFTIVQQVILTIFIIAIFPIFEGLCILSIFSKIEYLSNSQVAARVVSIFITNPFTDARKKDCINECKSYVDMISSQFSLYGFINIDEASIDYTNLFINLYSKPQNTRIRIISNEDSLIYDSIIDEPLDKQTFWIEDGIIKSSILTVSEYKKVFSEYMKTEKYFSGHDYYDGPFYSGDKYIGREIQLANSNGLGIVERFSLEYEALSMIYLAKPLYIGSDKIGVILISKPFYRINSDKKEWGFLLGRFAILSILLSFPFIIFLIFRLSLPIKNLSKKIIYYSNLDKFDNESKIPYENKNDEIGDLAMSFSIMMKKLKKNIEYFESFSSDVIHEFKNPLSSIGIQSEYLLSEATEVEEYREGVKTILAETKKINSLLEEMRDNSKFHNDIMKNVEKKDININAFLSNIIQKIKPFYPCCTFQIHAENKQNIIFANSMHLDRLFFNLIENAASFSSTVVISIFNKTNHKFEIVIEDAGPGIPNEEKKKIFNRFYSTRFDNKTSHSGLGLFNVKTIADINCWEINVGSSEKYGGAKFILQMS